MAATADLTDVFTALAPRFREATGREVALRFGASGLLTRQVREGAPFDVLAVADVRYLRELEALDLLVPGSRRSFALGHLATVHSPARLAVFFPSLLFGWLRARTRGIGASCLFHAMCNVFSEVLGKGYGLY